MSGLRSPPDFADLANRRAPMMERCDGESVGAYLENSDPANTAFYVRHGFVETGPLALATGAPGMTGMWRDPR